MGRILGLDYGTHRVGVAVSDPLGLIAGPLCTLDALDPGLWDQLRGIVAEQSVEAIVVGMPVGLSGIEGPAADAARAFAMEVGEETGIDVDLYDERFSTVTAEQILIEAGMRRSKRKETRDRVAATVILQAYLDGRR